MSNYTTEVRFIVEQASGLNASVGYNSINKMISSALPKIFDFDFPIFDESYRSILETKILKHYYTREIGFETVGLWKLRLDTKLNEIMPYYNKLYESQLLEFNPLYDVDYTVARSVQGNDTRNDTTNETRNEERTQTEKGTKTTNENKEKTENWNESNIKNDSGSRTENYSEDNEINNTSNESVNGNSTVNDNKTNKDVYSDTPQGALTGLESGEYMSNARIISDLGNSSSESEYSTDGSNARTETLNKDVSVEHENDSKENRTHSLTGKDTNNISGNTENTISGNIENTNNSTFNSVVNNTEEYLERVHGKRGGENYSTLLQKYRDTFLNIDMMVIDELNDLFMLVW